MSENPNISIEKGSDAWNVAQGYTHLKILKPLVELDKLVKISIYGTENIEDSLNTHEDIKTQMRIEAINRLIDTLRELIENSNFAMNQQDTKNELLKLKIRIDSVEKVIDAISRMTKDHRTQETKIIINEEHFWLCLEELRAIKKEIPDPLNKNSLIFPASDEIDMEKMKEQLIYGG